MAKTKLLLITDDSQAIELVHKLAEEIFFEDRISGMQDYKQSYETMDPDVIIVDIVTQDMKGFEALQMLKDKQSNAIILLLSGRQDSYGRLVSHLSMAAKLNITPICPSRFVKAN